MGGVTHGVCWDFAGGRTIMKTQLVGIAVMCAAGCAYAQMDITYNFPDDNTRDLTSDVFTVDGVSLTIDNPNGNLAFGNDTFAYITGLFVDGGLAPNLDFTFSQDVTLVSYTLSNQEIGASFSMVQGAVSSLGNDTTNLGTFAFSNTVDTYLGGQAVQLLSSNNDGQGYAFSSITVRTIPAPASAALIALGGLVASRRRRA